MEYAVIAFGLVFAVFVGTYYLLQVLPEQKAEQALHRRLQPTKKRRLGESLDLLRQAKPLSTVPLVEALVKRLRSTGTMQRTIEQAGLELTVGRLVLMSACGGMLAIVVMLYTFRTALLATAVGLAVSAIPFMVVRVLAKRRLAKLEEQFPEAIELIARALRSGHAFTTGVGMVADEMQDPMRAEFQMLYERQNFGMPLAEALKGFSDRAPLLDVRFFVTAVLTQRESGGNLSEVLDGLAAIIRDRFRLRRQVRALSAHGRITGAVLFCLPPALTAILFVIAPAHIGILFTDSLGIQMVTAAVVLQAIGFYAMRRIIDIEI